MEPQAELSLGVPIGLGNENSQHHRCLEIACFGIGAVPSTPSIIFEGRTSTLPDLIFRMIQKPRGARLGIHVGLNLSRRIYRGVGRTA